MNKTDEEPVLYCSGSQPGDIWQFLEIVLVVATVVMLLPSTEQGSGMLLVIL